MALTVLHPQIAGLKLQFVFLVQSLHDPFGIPQAGLAV